MKKIALLVVTALLVMALVFPGCEFLENNEPPATGETFQVTFLDLGQADGILVQAGSSMMLIDAGGNGSARELVSKLSGMGIKKLDVIVGTHPHEDHIGGMDAVIKEFDIGSIYMPRVTATTKTYLDVLNAIKDKGLTVTGSAPGSSFNLGPATCTILAPNSQEYDDMNNHSIVMRVFYGSTSFLFTGDAESVSEKEMIEKNYTLNSDVLKVGHHGSTSSTSKKFLQAVDPEYAVILVGKDNDYGHPHQETMDKLKAAGVKVYRTDLNGDITFTSDGSNLTVKTGR